MKKLIIIAMILFTGCDVNKISDNKEIKINTKCIDGIVHYEYHVSTDYGTSYFYIPKPDRKTNFYKLCDSI